MSPPIYTPDGSEVSEIVLPDGSTASEVIGPDGNVVFEAGGDIPDSALSRYQFEQDVTDSANGNDGVDNTSAGYVSDAQEGSYAKDFDGNNDYIDIGRFPLSDATFAVWIYPETVGNTIIARYDASSPPAGWILRINNNKIQLLNDNVTYSSNTDISANTWQHVAVANDADGDIRFYLNGQPDGVASGNGFDLTELATDITIGRRLDGAGSPVDYWDGHQDDLIIWDQPLSDSEVSDLYGSY